MINFKQEYDSATTIDAKLAIARKASQSTFFVGGGDKWLSIVSDLEAQKLAASAPDPESIAKQWLANNEESVSLLSAKKSNLLASQKTGYRSTLLGGTRGSGIIQAAQKTLLGGL